LLVFKFQCTFCSSISYWALARHLFADHLFAYFYCILHITDYLSVAVAATSTSTAVAPTTEQYLRSCKSRSRRLLSQCSCQLQFSRPANEYLHFFKFTKLIK